MGHSIKKSEQAIRNRFTAIEAALEDLSPAAFGPLTRQEIESDKLLAVRYQNRLMIIFLLIYHLRDDVRRFAKRCGLKWEIVEDFIKKSKPISICIRAGDTHKHGLGGRGKNATIPNGLLAVFKTAKGVNSVPSDRAIIVGMTLVDAEYGVFHTKVIIDQAINDWVQFLKQELKLDLTNWRKQCLPSTKNQEIYISPKRHVTVPNEAVVTFEFPQDLKQRLIKDIQKRANES